MQSYVFKYQLVFFKEKFKKKPTLFRLRKSKEFPRKLHQFKKQLSILIY